MESNTEHIRLPAPGNFQEEPLSGFCSTRKPTNFEDSSRKLPLTVRSDTGWMTKSAKDIDEQILLEKKTTYRCGILTGIILCICGLLSYIYDPVEHIQDWSMSINPNSRYLELWKDPPVTVYAKIYIFNITNPDKFLAKEEKLKLQEIGPFVFIESLRHTNVTFHGNSTMTYTPRRNATFVPELSVGDPTTMRVMVPNIALLGLGSMMADSTMLTNTFFLTFTKYHGWKPFLNLTVHEYFWGYDDPLVQMANTYASFWIPFSKLGILDRMYDEGDSEITLRLEDNGLAVTDPGYLHQYSIDSWDGSPGLGKWGYTDLTFQNREDPLRPAPDEKCKLIRGATEGVLFPRHLDPKMPIYAFRKTFCRTTRVEFKRRDSFMPGIVGHWYGLPDDVFDTPEVNPEQKCFCDPAQAKCLPKGMSEITPCYWNIPAAVSFPHFYKGDPALVDAIEGLSPDKDKHGSYAVIQPDLGSVVDFTSRIQTNLVMRDIKYNTDLIPFANLKLPFFWCELTSGGLRLESKVSLYFLLVALPVSQLISISLGFLSGVYLLWIVCSWVYRHHRANKPPVLLQPVINSSCNVILQTNTPD